MTNNANENTTYHWVGYNVRFARRLYDNGFVTIPADGKRVYLKDWPDYGRFDTEWEKLERIARTTAPGSNISHVFGPASDLVGVDIDVTDPTTSLKVQRLAMRMLGCTPFVRVGSFPKVAWFYRKSEKGDHQSMRFPNLEIFSSSGQMVWFGNHPVTGRPYVWPDKSPMRAESSVCPVVSPEMIKAFVVAANRVISDYLGLLEPSAQRDQDEVDMAAERKGLICQAYKNVLLKQLARMHPAAGNRHRIVTSVIGSMLGRGYNPTEIKKLLQKPYVDRFKGDGTNRTRKIEQITRGIQRKQARCRGRK